MTVISPNIVELVGNLQKQFGAPKAERPPPRPPIQAQSGDTAENRSGQRADGRTPPTTPLIRRSEPEARQKSLSRPAAPFQPERPANQPSTTFLTQLIGQQTATGSGANTASKKFDTAIAAYQRANGEPARSPSGVVFLSRRVDAII